MSGKGDFVILKGPPVNYFFIAELKIIILIHSHEFLERITLSFWVSSYFSYLLGVGVRREKSR